MNINIHTYEAFLLDYIEGRLTSHQTAVLKTFVARHPELGTWDDLVSPLPVVSAHKIVFDQKNNLFQAELEASDLPEYSKRDELFISHYEGIATKIDVATIEKLRAESSEANRDFELFGNVYFQPEADVHYPATRKLFKSAILPFQGLTRTLSYAASIVLLLGLGWWWIGNDSFKNAEKPQIALVNEPTEQPSTNVSETAEEKKKVETTIITEEAVESKKPPVKAKETKSTAKPKKKVSTPQSVPGNQQPKRQATIPAMPQGTNVIQLNISYLEGAQLKEDRSMEEQLTLAFVMEQMPEYRVVEGKPAHLRVLDNVMDKALATVNPSEAGNENSSRNNTNLTLWDIAQRGISTYNFLTDKDVQLVKAHDLNGNNTAVQLTSDKINYSRISSQR